MSGVLSLSRELDGVLPRDVMRPGVSTHGRVGIVIVGLGMPHDGRLASVASTDDRRPTLTKESLKSTDDRRRIEFEDIDTESRLTELLSFRVAASTASGRAV